MRTEPLRVGAAQVGEPVGEGGPGRELLQGEVEFGEPGRRREVDEVRELLLAGEVAQLSGQVEGLLLVDEGEEEGEVGGGLDEVQFVHAVLDVRGQVEAADEVDALALRLQDLGDLEGDGSAVGVSGDGVGAVRLLGADRVDVGGDHLLEALEGLLPRVEAAGPQRVERPVAHEVLGEVDEDEDLADARVDAEQRGLVAHDLHGDDRVVGPFGAGVLAEPGGEFTDGGGGEHGDDLEVVRAEPLGDQTAQPQDVQGSAAQVEEVGGGAQLLRVGVEHLGVDPGEDPLGVALGGGVSAEAAQDEVGDRVGGRPVGAGLQAFAHQARWILPRLVLGKASLGSGRISAGRKPSA